MELIHFGKAFKKIRRDGTGIVKLYESVCKSHNIPEREITYTVTKVSCRSCLKVIRERRESEIRAINLRIIELDHRNQSALEILL